MIGHRGYHVQDHAPCSPFGHPSHVVLPFFIQGNHRPGAAILVAAGPYPSGFAHCCQRNSALHFPQSQPQEALDHAPSYPGISKLGIACPGLSWLAASPLPGNTLSARPLIELASRLPEIVRKPYQSMRYSAGDHMRYSAYVSSYVVVGAPHPSALRICLRSR